MRFQVPTLAFAVLIGCGDPLLDSSVSIAAPQDSWWDRYAPNTAGLVWFPDLETCENPRLTSSNTDVARVDLRRLFAPDDGRELRLARQARITTNRLGSSDISLYDGDRLVRTETIDVVELDGIELDVTHQRARREEIVWAPGERPGVQELLLDPKELVFFRFDRPIFGAIRFFDHADNDIFASTQLTDRRAGFSLRTNTQWLWSGLELELMRVDGSTSAFGSVAPSGEVLNIIVPAVRDSDVAGLTIRTLASSNSETGESMVTVAVYGIAAPDEGGQREAGVVYGLNPVLTLNGEILWPADDLNYPWLFEYDLPLPEGVTAASLQASWRTLTTTVNGPTGF